MEKDWIKIYSSPQVHQIEIVKGVLEDNNIKSVDINKHDSSYRTFGEIELYVNRQDALKALQIINKNEL